MATLQDYQDDPSLIIQDLQQIDFDAQRGFPPLLNDDEDIEVVTRTEGGMAFQAQVLKVGAPERIAKRLIKRISKTGTQLKTLICHENYFDWCGQRENAPGWERRLESMMTGLSRGALETTMGQVGITIGGITNPHLTIGALLAFLLMKAPEQVNQLCECDKKQGKRPPRRWRP